MTRLFATAGGIAVNRILDVHRSDDSSKELSAHAGRLASMPKELDESTVVSEMSLIEACSSSKKPYIMSSKWDESSRQQLDEFAAICGCKTICVDPESDIVKAAMKPTMEKAASSNLPVVTASKKPALDIGDVFGIEGKGDMSHLDKSKWEQISSEAKIMTPDVVSHRAGAILPTGGGESYEISPHLRVKPGQNSVTAPDAIGELLRTKGEDIATSLKRQKEEREAFRTAGARASEEKLADRMSKDKDYAAYGNRRVHLTETMTAQPGIKDGKIMPGAFQKDVKNMDDKTTGEKLGEQAQQRKTGIQRQASTTKTEFKVEAAAKITLSDVFTMPEKWLPKQKETPKS